MALDILVLVPTEPSTGALADPIIRRTEIAHLRGPLQQAFAELEEYVGRPLHIAHPDAALRFGDERWPVPRDRPGGREARRSLSAVTHATHLERAGLRWAANDPGARELSYWRRRLAEHRADEPRCVAICSTFLTHEGWIRALCAIVRQTLPGTKLLLGGYFYAVNAKKFLSLDADVLCLGEGEERLPQIVRAIRDGGSLDQIPGLYLRRPDGTLHATGRAEPLNLEELSFSDWSLSARIDPPIALADVGSTVVETQRGCVFRCEFCDYRTIALPNVMSAERAAEAILAAARGTRGGLRLTDATASFPHKRWKRVMEHLIAAGGCPAPIWCYTRVSDIDDETAALMSRAGVRHVYVGQESGDQRIILAMKKGTSVDQVKPAVAALAKYDICATFSFIHGFPGEDAASIAATRAMIVHMNDGFESRPPVLQHLVNPLQVIDFASVSRKEEMQGIEHWMAYGEQGGCTPAQAIAACYDTIVAASRVPHAPAFLIAPGDSSIEWEDALFFTPHRYELFRWYKTIERGTVIFLERAVEGTPPDGAELSRIKDRILSYYDTLPVWRTAATKVSARVKKMVASRLRDECLREPAEGPGLLSRALVGLAVWRDMGSLDFARRAFEAGVYPDPRQETGAADAASSPSNVDAMAGELIEETFGEEQHQRRLESARKIVAPDRLARGGASKVSVAE